LMDSDKGSLEEMLGKYFDQLDIEGLDAQP
jgi:hypothetical protein